MASQQPSSVSQHMGVLFGPGSVTGLSERQLLDRYLATGDQSAFEGLVTRLGPMVFGVCQRMLNNPNDVEDAFQATFLILVRKAGSLQNRDLLGAWLYGVAHRVAVRARRNTIVHRTRERTSSAEVGNMGSSPEDKQADLREILDDEVNRLPDRFRLPVVLCLVQGLTQEEAASRLRWTPGTVRGRLARARVRLRDRLTRLGVEPSLILLNPGFFPTESLNRVPPALLEATVEAAKSVAGGGLITAGVSANTLSFMKGALEVMRLTQLKRVATTIVLASTLLTATLVLVVRAGIPNRASPPGQPLDTPVAVKANPLPRDDQDPLPSQALARVGTRRFRHNHTVTALSYSTDGALLASGSWDNTCRVWDTKTGRELQRFSGLIEVLSTVALSPDKKLLAAGGLAPGSLEPGQSGPSGLVLVWDLHSGKEVLRAEKLENTALAVRFSADGNRMAASTGNIIRIWKTDDWNALLKIVGPEQGVRPIAFTPDGSSLVAGCDDRTVRVYEMPSGREIRKLTGPGDGLNGFAISPDGQKIATAGADHMIRVWNASAGLEARHFAGAGPEVDRVVFSPDGKTLASWTADGTIYLQDALTGAFLRTARKAGLDQASVSSVTFSPDGRTIAAGGDGKAIWFWDASTGHEIRRAEGHQDAVKAVGFALDGSVLATCAGDSVVCLWDRFTGKLVRRWVANHNGLSAMASSPDGRLLATVGGDNAVRVWDAETGQEVQTLLGHGEGQITSVAFAPDSITVASGSWQDRTVRLWNAGTGELTRTINLPRGEHGHNYGDLPLAFSTDGRMLASGSGDRTHHRVFLWDVTSGKLLHALSASTNSLAFAPKENLLAMAAGRTIRLWNPITGQELPSLSGGSDDAGTVLAFSADGKILASGGGSRPPTVRLWDMASRQDIGRFTGDSGWITSIAISPDGRTLATGSDDTTATLWDMRRAGPKTNAPGVDHP